uniref:Rhodanese domain-containing protein n=1 Tax=Loa loa TaxID=7209 RepID=A0A1I7VVR7_LOALO
MSAPLYQLSVLISSFAKYSAVVSRMQCKWKGSCRTQRQILDTALGVIVWKELTEVDFFSGYIWDGLAMMITNLEELIHWLTTYPAGLKLNTHLNAILSQFFVYHIYLWQTYLSVASVYVGFGFISLSCFFGVSVFFAALSDLLRLLTVHIYCFHIYAFKLATISMMSIKSLWRLFRGRKYNPLRERVDSVKLDARQLFIATLFFIILLFLLPTILVYFFIFSSLHCGVRTIQMVLLLLSMVQDEKLRQLAVAEATTSLSGFKPRLLFPASTYMFIAVPLPAISIDRLVAILTDEKALATKPLAILDVRPEEQFVKGHIIGAEHYPRILLSREQYETESMKRVGAQGTLIVCGQVYGAGQVVSTFCDRGYNAVLLRGDLDSWRHKYPEGLLTRASGEPIKLELSKLAAQLSINRKPVSEGHIQHMQAHENLFCSWIPASNDQLYEQEQRP